MKDENVTIRSKQDPKNIERIDENAYIVRRSIVDKADHYSEYRQQIRKDFFFSCAYCTMTEAEAQAIRFTIDHYEPQSERPDLTNQYDNLMYACDECNRYKSDLIPSASAVAAGKRYFRPDQDIRPKHFECKEVVLEGKTEVGKFTVTAISLNRLNARRLRELRRRIYESQEIVANGLLQLRGTKLDLLPKEIRSRAAQAIKDASENIKVIEHSIDETLMRYVKSPYLDPAPEADPVNEQRRSELHALQGLHPGRWRGRQRSS